MGEEAISDYNQAVLLDPNNADAHYNLGTTKADLERYAEAIADYNQAIRLDPDYANAYYSRGFAKAKTKQYIKAMRDFTKAMKLKLFQSKLLSRMLGTQSPEENV